MLLFVCVLGLGAFTAFHARQERSAIQGERTGLVERIAPEASSAWNEIRLLERSALEKRNYLGKRLNALDRNSSEDEQYKMLDAEYQSIRQARIDLEYEIDEIYLTYEKQILKEENDAPSRSIELRKKGQLAAQRALSTLEESP